MRAVVVDRWMEPSELAVREAPEPALRPGTMLVDVTVGVPDPGKVDVDRVRKELPHGEVTVRPVAGGLRVPGSDTIIACVAITVSVRERA